MPCVNTAGGILRDVLCAEVPLILRKEIYATASLLAPAAVLFRPRGQHLKLPHDAPNTRA